MNNKVQQKDRLELTLVQDYAHQFTAMGSMCPCSRCQGISYLYNLRKFADNALREKYSPMCEYIAYEHTDKVTGKVTIKKMHDRHSCLNADRDPKKPVTNYCLERRHLMDTWTVYLAGYDLEAFAWRRIADSKLNRKQNDNDTRPFYTIEGDDIVKTVTDSETGEVTRTSKTIQYYVKNKMKELTQVVERITNPNNGYSQYLKDYSTQSPDWESVSQFEILKATSK